MAVRIPQRISEDLRDMSRLLSRALDVLTRPQIERFAFKSALRTSREDFLEGTHLAGRAVHDAIRKGIEQEDDSGLSELASQGALLPPLHVELCEEIRRGRAEGDWALDLMLTELAAQAEQLDEPPHGVLNHCRLIVGAQRSEFADGSTMLAMHRFHCGSHLVVIDDRPDQSIWSVERQRHLLSTRGCTVQCEVVFGSSKPQRFLFEAAVDGAAILGGDDDENGLCVSVADLNRMTGGSFWHAASEVKPPYLSSVWSSS